MNERQEGITQNNYTSRCEILKKDISFKMPEPRAFRN